jgi:hypothetical protein
VTRVVGPNVAHQVHPPIGTPVSVTLSFAPSDAVPTFGYPAGLGCRSVDVSASVAIGGHTWAGGGSGFTHAALPDTTCSGFDFTQFSLHSLTPPTDNPWAGDMSNTFILSYRDLLVQDAFPEFPTSRGGVAALWSLASNPQFEVGAGLRWAVEQTSPVPEPGTLVLLGMGLAAAARARRRR